MVEQGEFRVYGYRWIVLLAFMFVVAVNQMMWITYAPITSSAANFYGVTDLSIGLLSLIFMVVYIFVSIPASWAIDTYGVQVAVGIGAVLTGGFGLLRGLASADYNLALVAQTGIAIGQPFILNAATTVAARWFPIKDRATITGLGSLAIYLGIIVGLAITPYLTAHSNVGGTLLVYGVIGVIAAVVFVVLARERPPTPPCRPDQEERSLMFDGLKDSLRRPNFVLLLTIFFVGLGVFNAVTTWIEDIVRPRGFSSIQAGNIGGLMILGGIIGAVLIPLLSDRYRKRVPFLLAALVGAIVGLLGVTFATSYALLLGSAFLFGFSLLSAGPLGFQYGAEITQPTPEGTSNGLLLMVGQISGIAFIVAMDGFKAPDGGSMTAPLLALIALMAASLLICTRLKDPQALLTDKGF